MKDWFPEEYVPVAASAELRKRPLRRYAFGRPIVLARRACGQPFALHDPCPHRGAPLSRGRLVGDELECPYHGIRFSHDGVVQSLPFAEGPCHLRARAHQIIEQDGMLFASGSRDAAQPPSLKAPDHWRRASLALEMSVPYAEVVENFMDSTHTGVVHTGLIRSTRARVPRSVEVIAGDRSVEVYHESTEEDLGIARRWLGAGAISHKDTCHLPGVVEVEYAVNGEPFFRALIFPAPRFEAKTEVHVRVAFAAPRSGRRGRDLLRAFTDRLAELVVPAIGRRVLRQDRDLLEATERSVARSEVRPRAYQSGEVMHAWVHRLLRGDAETGTSRCTLLL